MLWVVEDHAVARGLSGVLAVGHRRSAALSCVNTCNHSAEIPERSLLRESAGGVTVARRSERCTRERLYRLGPARLADVELVTLLVGAGGQREPPGVFATRLLHEVGGLQGLARLPASALERVRGIGPSRAGRLAGAAELGRRLVERPLSRRRRLTSSREVDAALRPRLAGEEVEHFFAIALDAKNRPLAEIMVSRGSVTACPVAPSDVFRPLLREAAVGVVLVHNHPSGEPTPSRDDVVLTERLRRAGQILGVEVLDHVIIGRAGYFSFLDAGLFRGPSETRRSAPP